jgi:hypothetical protein
MVVSSFDIRHVKKRPPHCLEGASANHPELYPETQISCQKNYAQLHSLRRIISEVLREPAKSATNAD